MISKHTKIVGYGFLKTYKNNLVLENQVIHQKLSSCSSSGGQNLRMNTDF